MSRGQPLLHVSGFVYWCPMPDCFGHRQLATLEEFRRHIEDEHPECLLGTAPGGYSSSVAVIADRACVECGDSFRPNWIGQQTCSQRCQERRRNREKREAKRKMVAAPAEPGG